MLNFGWGRLARTLEIECSIILSFTRNLRSFVFLEAKHNEINFICICGQMVPFQNVTSSCKSFLRSETEKLEKFSFLVEIYEKFLNPKNASAVAQHKISSIKYIIASSGFLKQYKTVTFMSQPTLTFKVPFLKVKRFFPHKLGCPWINSNAIPLFSVSA